MRGPVNMLSAAAAICIGLLCVNRATAHCEIPCGIYGDRMRLDMLREHCRTVEKSMKMVEELGAAENKDPNQLVRWVVNKENHATKIQEIVYQYFLNQRITPRDKADEKAHKTYVTQVTLLHRMLVQAMKCKQTTDVRHVESLRTLLDLFDRAYFETQEKEE